MKTYILLLLCCIQWTVTAQGSKASFKTNSARKSLREAQQLVNQERYEDAIKKLRHTIKIKPDFAIAYREMGHVYLEIKAYQEAIEALEQSFELDDKLSRAAFFECGEAYFMLEQPEKAHFYYQQFLEMEGSRYANKSKESGMELGYTWLLEEREANLAYIQSMGAPTTDALPSNMGKIINSSYDDYLPTITSDGNQLVFTRQGKHGDEDVVTCEYKNGGWKKSRAFGKAINTKQNEGMAKFETHGRAFYFSGCMREDTKGGCDIYQAFLEQDDVKEVRKLPGLINSQFWDSQPSITCDGTKMFFTSNREGGLGGADIWYSELKANGDWSFPKNMGSAINSAGDEEAPFISSDGNTIYFTSSGHQGQGDGDLFISKLENGQWSKAINMGLPFNSPAKELGFYIQGDGKTAYFSSARKGGNGGLDIYTIELPEVMRPNPMVHLEGIVRDAKSEQPLQSKVIIRSEGQQWEMETDEKGMFFTCLPGNKSYSIQSSLAGYEPYIEAKFLKAQDNAAPACYLVNLQPEGTPKAEFVSKGVEIKEKRIQFFFDFDSYELADVTKKDLENLAKMLHDEPDWRVEVVGYTDTKGDYAYNMALSEKRAKSIVDFLNSAGITIDQVVRNEGRGAVKSSEGKVDARKARRVDVILRK